MQIVNPGDMGIAGWWCWFGCGPACAGMCAVGCVIGCAADLILPIADVVAAASLGGAGGAGASQLISGWLS